ncbi:CYIR protein, partial [Plasmodium cynomolgi strain B]
VKQLCIKLVRHLCKLNQENSSKRSNYCNYIRYWLFEQIGVIYTGESASIGDEPFFKKLIETWEIINMFKLKSTCNPEKIKGVNLNELKNRIFSYIYFKNLEEIKKISNENGKDCNNQYMTNIWIDIVEV